MGMVMRGGLLAVDTFFFMSGFLACLTILRGLRPTPQSELKVTFLGFCQRAPLAVVRRYLRLTPVYAFVIFAYTYFAPAVTDGPFVDGLKDTGLCKKLWWQNLLYVNNLLAVHNFEMCMSHSWFLGIDMQVRRTSSRWGWINRKDCPMEGVSSLGSLSRNGCLHPISYFKVNRPSPPLPSACSLPSANLAFR